MIASNATNAKNPINNEQQTVIAIQLVYIPGHLLSQSSQFSIGQTL